MKKFIFLIFLVLAGLFVISAQDAVSCSCINFGNRSRDAFNSASYVFYGTAVDIKPLILYNSSGWYNNTFEINTKWKGEIGRTINILTYPANENNTGVCGRAFETNKSFLVFADDSYDDFGVCSPRYEDEEFQEFISTQIQKVNDDAANGPIEPNKNSYKNLIMGFIAIVLLIIISTIIILKKTKRIKK